MHLLHKIQISSVFLLMMTMYAIFQLVTRAPAECMCRPCTAVDEASVMPSEIVGYADAANMISSFGSMTFQK